MHLRALIADDEPSAREWLRDALERLPDLEIVGECADGLKAAHALRELSPDVVFLDIDMPGLDGLRVASSLATESRTVVVFVTAHDLFAVRAFDQNAVDYLLKPFGRERVEAAVKRVRRRLLPQSVERLETSLSRVLDDMEVRRAHPRWLLVRDGVRSVLLKVADVDYIESQRNHVLLHAGKDVYAHRETTRTMEERLDPARFLRIHRSTIVNLERVKELRASESGESVVVLRDDTVLAVSAAHQPRLEALRRFS